MEPSKRWISRTRRPFKLKSLIATLVPSLWGSLFVLVGMTKRISNKKNWPLRPRDKLHRRNHWWNLEIYKKWTKWVRWKSSRVAMLLLWHRNLGWEVLLRLKEKKKRLEIFRQKFLDSCRRISTNRCLNHSRKCELSFRSKRWKSICLKVFLIASFCPTSKSNPATPKPSSKSNWSIVATKSWNRPTLAWSISLKSNFHRMWKDRLKWSNLSWRIMNTKKSWINRGKINLMMTTRRDTSQLSVSLLIRNVFSRSSQKMTKGIRPLSEM